MPDAYVEPVPEVFARLARYAERGELLSKDLDPQGSLGAGAYFRRTAEILRVLEAIAKDEVLGRPLSKEELQFLSMIVEITWEDIGCGFRTAFDGWYFQLFRDYDQALKHVGFVADYYTSGWLKEAAYIGARATRLGVFVVDTGGPPRVVVGPVASAYETTSPLDTRLNDEASLKLPEAKKSSPWSASYTVPAAAEPALGITAKFETTTVGAQPDQRTGDVTIMMRAPHALGPVTVELMDHHRTPVARLTKDVGAGIQLVPLSFPRGEGAGGEARRGDGPRAGGRFREVPGGQRREPDLRSGGARGCAGARAAGLTGSTGCSPHPYALRRRDSASRQIGLRTCRSTRVRERRSAIRAPELSRDAMTLGNFRLVLRLERLTEGATGGVDAACKDVNERLEFSFRRAPDEHPGPGVTTQVWRDESVGQVSLVEDSNISTVYASPSLRVGYGHQTICDALKRRLVTVPVEELRSAAAAGEPTPAAALVRLGLGDRDDYDARTARILRNGLENPDLEIRRAAALAIFLLKWSAFRPALDEAIATEANDDLRASLTVARDCLSPSLLV